MRTQAKAPTVSRYKYKTRPQEKHIHIPISSKEVAERKRERERERERDMEPEDGSGGGGSGGDEGGGGDINKQPQQRRLMTMQVHEQPHAPHPQQQTQRCPRCESLNTKFCYYNNYSLSQPRYFCKTCRRYWTQGGTLRNVPVGGGCRKGKSAKTSSSSVENCRSRLQSPPQEVVHTQPNSTTVIRAKDPSAAGSPSPAVPSISPYYQGGGYLSSLAAIQSLNPSQPFNQSLNGGGDALGSSNLALLSGFTAASLGSQPLHQLQCQIRPSQIYQMSDRERELESLYPAEQGLVQSSIDNSSPASRHDWPQSFINNANHRASDASLWSTISTTSIGDISESNNASAGSSYLIPNQWPDLRGP